jgi:hypothetical protein
MKKVAAGVPCERQFREDKQRDAVALGPYQKIDKMASISARVGERKNRRDRRDT